MAGQAGRDALAPSAGRTCRAGGGGQTGADIDGIEVVGWRQGARRMHRTGCWRCTQRRATASGAWA